MSFQKRNWFFDTRFVSFAVIVFSVFYLAGCSTTQPSAEPQSARQPVAQSQRSEDANKRSPFSVLYWIPNVFAASCSVKKVSAFAEENQDDRKKTIMVAREKRTLINPPSQLSPSVLTVQLVAVLDPLKPQPE